jgi:hypothetical protein
MMDRSFSVHTLMDQETLVLGVVVLVKGLLIGVAKETGIQVINVLEVLEDVPEMLFPVLVA